GKFGHGDVCLRLRGDHEVLKLLVELWGEDDIGIGEVNEELVEAYLSVIVSGQTARLYRLIKLFKGVDCREALSWHYLPPMRGPVGLRCWLFFTGAGAA